MSHILEMLKDLIIPAILLCVGGLGKSLVRGRHEDEDWFMGADLLLAGLGTMLASAADSFGVIMRSKGLLRLVGTATQPSNDAIGNAGMTLAFTVGYAVVAIFLYFSVLRAGQAAKQNSYSR